MSDSLYYSNDAVSRGLSRIEESSAKIRNTLITNAALSTTMLKDSIERASVASTEMLTNEIRGSTYAIVASQQYLAQTFQSSFNSVDNTLKIGISELSDKLSSITDSISALNYSICSKLDEIHDIVNNPLLTQSRELYRLALINFEKGYYEEALEDVKAAVEKNKTDFISWNLLGHVYLFGEGKFSNVIDIDKAEEAFFNAAKYIDSDIATSEEAKELASKIYFYLGCARLAKSNALLSENKIEESHKKLEEAEKASGTAYELLKTNLLAAYEQAKELHFLGKDEEALSILREIIKQEKNFAIKASCDNNFKSIWDKIDNLVTELRDEVAEKIQKQTSEICSLAEEKTNALKKEIEGLNLPTEEEFKALASFIKQKFDEKLPELEHDISNQNSVLDKLDHLLVLSSEMEEFQKYLDEKTTAQKELVKLEAKKELLTSEVTPPDTDSFFNECASVITSLGKEMQTFKDAENKDYFSALQAFETLSEKTADEWVDPFIEPLDKPLFKLKEYSNLVKDKVIELRQEAEEEKRFNSLSPEERDKERRSRLIVGIIFIIAGFFLPSILSGILVVFGGMSFCVAASSRKRLRFIFVPLLATIISFFLGHKFIGVVNVLTTLLFLGMCLSWKDGKKAVSTKEASSDEKSDGKVDK